MSASGSGGCLPLGQTPPWADTPPGQTPLCRYPLWADIPWADTPLGRHPRQTHPAHCMLEHTHRHTHTHTHTRPLHSGIHPRHGQNSGHTLVKTIPSRNYCNKYAPKKFELNLTVAKCLTSSLVEIIKNVQFQIWKNMCILHNNC